jgi:hypothetical protein
VPPVALPAVVAAVRERLLRDGGPAVWGRLGRREDRALGGSPSDVDRGVVQLALVVVLLRVFAAAEGGRWLGSKDRLMAEPWWQRWRRDSWGGMLPAVSAPGAVTAGGPGRDPCCSVWCVWPCVCGPAGGAASPEVGRLEALGVMREG